MHQSLWKPDLLMAKILLRLLHAGRARTSMHLNRCRQFFSCLKKIPINWHMCTATRMRSAAQPALLNFMCQKSRANGANHFRPARYTRRTSAYNGRMQSIMKLSACLPSQCASGHIKNQFLILIFSGLMRKGTNWQFCKVWAICSIQ